MLAPSRSPYLLINSRTRSANYLSSFSEKMLITSTNTSKLHNSYVIIIKYIFCKKVNSIDGHVLLEVSVDGDTFKMVHIQSLGS